MVRRTPLLHLEASVYGKAENFQLRGSYKIRGVAHALSSRRPDELKRGVCTVSAGNLGQALAFVAAARNIPCRILVPDVAPRIKKERIRSLGAELTELPFTKIWDIVLTGTYNSDMLFLHPVFNADLVAGYGSIASEILEDLPDLDDLVIPYGLGGLFCGIAQYLKEYRPHVRLYASEIEGSSPVDTALSESDAPARLDPVPTKPFYVDAIGTPEVVPQLFAKVRPGIEGSIVVSEAQTLEALRNLYYEHGFVVEGAAAVSYAAARLLSLQRPRSRIACILSGRNINPETLFSLI